MSPLLPLPLLMVERPKPFQKACWILLLLLEDIISACHVSGIIHTETMSCWGSIHLEAFQVTRGSIWKPFKGEHLEAFPGGAWKFWLINYAI